MTGEFDQSPSIHASIVWSPEMKVYQIQVNNKSGTDALFEKKYNL